MDWHQWKERWRQHDPVPLTASLVAQPTYGEPLGVEDAAIQILAERFDRLGIPYQVRRAADGRAFNLSVRIGEGEPTLLFNGHLDVVPPGDEAAWSQPPFAPQVIGDRLYGRGACDAKGAVACMVTALERLWEEGVSQRAQGSVLFVAVGGEEKGGAGILHEIENGMQAQVALVGEPTRCAPHVAHKGRFTLRIHVEGVAAHASRPDVGVNAIEQAALLFPFLERIRQETAAQTHPLLGPASSTVTQILGGTAVNVVPDSCTLVIDRRLLPGESIEGAMKAYDQAIAEAVGQHPSLRVSRSIEEAALPAETTDAAWVQHLKAVVSDVFGSPVEAAGFPATCDMAHIVHEAGIPTAIFGPGDLDLAHQIDEWVPVGELYTATEVYYRLARTWLTTGGAFGSA